MIIDIMSARPNLRHLRDGNTLRARRVVGYDSVFVTFSTAVYLVVCYNSSLVVLAVGSQRVQPHEIGFKIRLLLSMKKQKPLHRRPIYDTIPPLIVDY